MKPKYELCPNPSWTGATFTVDEIDKYGYALAHKSVARCMHCNRFFNWRKLNGLSGWRQTVDLHCPHCNGVVYETNY